MIQCRFVLIACFCFATSLLQAEWYRDTQPVMGTEVSAEIWADTPEQGQVWLAAVMAEMRRVDEQFSPYRDSSELSRVNAQAGREPVRISAEMRYLLEKSRYYAVLSEGAFDISFASVGRYYDYREGERPEDERLQALQPAINYQLIILDAEQHTVRFEHPELQIDLGGIAKGHAVDRAIDYLQQQGVQSAIVSAGGDSRILGDRRGTPWLVGVKHPRKPGEFAVKIPLENTAISTSGDYERFFVAGGERFHHILSPGTGKSATGVQSVTILADRSIDADALSTTVFVLGVQRGLALINGLPAVDGFIIDADGKLHYSAGLLRQGS